MSSKKTTDSPMNGESQPLLKKVAENNQAKYSKPNDKDLESNGVTVGAPEDETTVEKDNKILIIAFGLMLIFQLGNRIFGKLQTVVA